ncbi:hypothetical protein HY383_04055 [Candidatus Daviesbacteria bacterium]|nr:hypothetical protein [Candidatus Daviesbacteria bacterium]
MNTFGSTSSKVNPKNILGGILGGFEEDFETEASMVSSAAKKGVGGLIDAVMDLGQDVAGIEPKKETNGEVKFPSKGTLEFSNAQTAQAEQAKKQKEIDRKKVFFQNLKEEQAKAQREKEQLEEEIDDIAANLPISQKNELLHYQSSYKDKSVYQRAELRRKLIEQRKQADQQQKDESKAATNPKGKFSMGENELLMGGENKGGHWSQNPG